MIYKKNIFMALVMLLCLPAGIEANDTGLNGYNQQLFRPQTDGYGLYNTSGSKVLPHLKYSLGLFTNLSRNNVGVDMPARLSSEDLIDTNVTTDFQGSLGLFNIMDVGLNIPVAFYEHGTNYNDLQKYSTSALGDLRMDVKFRIFKDEPKSVGLALMSIASFPTGSRSKFTGEDGPTWEGKLILDKTIERVSFFANGGYRFVKQTKILDTTLDDRITFGGGVSFRLPVGNNSWLLLAEATGETVARDLKKKHTPFEIWGGVRKEFDSGLIFNFGGGRRVFDAISASDLRLFAGLSFNLQKREEALRKKAITEGVLDVKDTIYFGFDKTDVSPDYSETLNRIGNSLVQNKNARIVAEGHTDNVGAEDYNKQLGLKRAENVKKYLIKNNVSAEQIIVKTYGEEKPAADNKTKEGRSKNRRVEVYTEPQ